MSWNTLKTPEVMAPPDLSLSSGYSVQHIPPRFKLRASHVTYRVRRLTHMTPSLHEVRYE